MLCLCCFELILSIYRSELELVLIFFVTSKIQAVAKTTWIYSFSAPWNYINEFRYGTPSQSSPEDYTNTAESIVVLSTTQLIHALY